MQLSPEAIKLAEANIAMPHAGVKGNEWAVASVYAAVKVTDCSPIPIGVFIELLNKDPEISGFTAYSEKHVLKHYKMIIAGQEHAPRVCNFQPTIYVRKIAEQLNMPPRALGYAIRLSEEAVRKRLHWGRNPSVVAAAIIQLTNEKFKLKLPKKEIADRAGCTCASILNDKRYLASKLEVEEK